MKGNSIYRIFLLSACLSFFTVLSFAQSEYGLVAYYPFSGNTADSSGNHHDGTITGGVTLTADRFGNPNSAYHFDGTSGYILCPNDSNLLKSKNASYSVWFQVQNRPSWDQNVILANIGSYEQSGGFEAFTGNPPGNYASMFRNSTHLDQQLNGLDSIQPDVWYQLLVVMRYDSLIDSTTVINYIDCVFDDSARFAGSINYDAISQLFIGANRDIACCQRYFLGDIDEVKIYDIALNPCGATYVNTTVNIACGDSFIFGGIAYYLPVTKTETITGTNGDSVITLTLIVTDTVNLLQKLCAGDSLQFYNEWIRNAGEYDTLIHVVNNCDSLLILTVNMSPAPYDSIFADRTLICKGDSTHLCSIDSFAYYSWTGGESSNCITVTEASSYQLTITDNNNCTSTSNVIAIAQLPVPVVSIQPDSALICTSDSVQLCASPGFLYQWNTGEDSICIYVMRAGNYYLTVTDSNHCTAESNRANLQIFPTSSVSLIVYGDTFESNNAKGYQWYFDGQIISGSNTDLFIAKQPGNYAVQVTDSNGCTTLSNSVTYTGIENITEEKNSLIIYPNPAVDYLIVEHLGFTDNISIELLDMLGRVIKAEPIKEGATKTEIDTHELGSGLYFLRILEGGVAMQTVKFNIAK